MPDKKVTVDSQKPLWYALDAIKDEVDGLMPFENARQYQISRLQKNVEEVRVHAAREESEGESAGVPPGFNWAKELRSTEEALKALRDLREGDLSVDQKTGGATYRVRLAPKEDEYLLWNEPFSKQSREGQSGIAAGDGEDGA